MTRNKKILIGVGIAVAAYLIYRWWQNRQAQDDGNSPTGSYGTNLNSVAPELVGGSSGPSVGPAVALPVHITLVEKGSQPGKLDMGSNPMTPAATGQSANPIFRQTGSSMQPSNGGGAYPYADSASDAAGTSFNDNGGDRSGTTHEVEMPDDYNDDSGD